MHSKVGFPYGNLYYYDFFFFVLLPELLCPEVLRKLYLKPTMEQIRHENGGHLVEFCNLVDFYDIFY